MGVVETGSQLVLEAGAELAFLDGSVEPGAEKSASFLMSHVLIALFSRQLAKRRRADWDAVLLEQVLLGLQVREEVGVAARREGERDGN